ncbi:restriction modification system DNA specificity subunit [Herbaspirillum rubrisubalbicans M1]|uniref:restriction endonuclease subunit S n=1 Tax=Herbaspirillum rubrisubalbicans TaxID=80842 RepID=UPI00073ADDD0|nr:restriction endonuclease subunit S [Herbaspirillum rubrisubalbicans]ALU87262.1 restriction modification system DNA specificity subunit [Herbaspirillum rubrisubalbicans M1]
MLPKEWKQVPLHTVAEVRTGLSKNAQRAGATLKRPYLRVANVQDGALDLSDVHEIEVPASQTSRYTLQAGDLLLIEGNGNPENLGRGCLWHGQIPDAVHQNHVFAVRTHKNGPLLPAFLELQIQSKYGRNYFLSCAKGSTGLSSLNSTQLKSFPVILPPFEEQLRIARVIQTWSGAIAAAEKLLANSYKQKQAVIGCFLMPVPLSNAKRTVGAAFPSSVQPGIPQLPPAPKGWFKTTLGTHLKEVIRPVSLDPTQNYRLVTVRRSRGGVDERCKLPGAEIKTPTQFYVHEGDFLISKRQIVHGACGIVPPELDGAIVSNEYAVLNTYGDLDPRFLRYLSETTYFQQTCFHSSIGVHIEKMLFRLDKWLKWPINLPPLGEQLRIVAILDAASQEETTIQKQLDLLREEKRALMADLLTGKRRVRMPDTTAEPEAA